MWQELHGRILDDVRRYTRQRHAIQPFEPGVTPIPYAGRVFDEEEVAGAVEAVLDFWLTLGPRGHDLETQLARRVGTQHALLVNSGSSANLVAFATLTSPQ